MLCLVGDVDIDDEASSYSSSSVTCRGRSAGALKLDLTDSGTSAVFDNLSCPC